MKKRSKKQGRKRERYTQLNAEFQRITKRDKKALNGQGKEIEENNRMRKTRDLKNTRDIKGILHARIGRIKNRNSEDLTVAEEVKKRWQEYTEELYKKGLLTWVTTMMWSLTQSQTSWNVKSSGPWEALLQAKLVEVMEFQLSYVKS